MSLLTFIKTYSNLVLNVVSPRRREPARLRAKWGQCGDNDGWSASRYFDLTRDESTSPQVDDTTWEDLEFPKLFSDIDSTETEVGGQVLYRKLREYVSEQSELKKRYSAYSTLRSDAALREGIQLRLTPLRANSFGEIADSIFGQPLERPKHHNYIQAWSLVSIATFVGVLTTVIPVALWLGVLGANLFVIFSRHSAQLRDMERIKNCHRLLRVADSLAAMAQDTKTIAQFEPLADQASLRARLKKEIQLSFLQRDQLLQSVSSWLNFVFLFELVAYVRTIERFVGARAELASTFELVGSLDADIAISSYLELFPDHCHPEVEDGQLIDIDDAYHPLIDKPIKNSIRLSERSALITGSNMAGKTTFIKMVGINVILGRTIGVCFARSATLPSSTVMGSIRGQQSVESGKSNYFTQIEAIHSFIENAQQGTCTLFVIDELFSGTNTVERLAASRAVMESISRHAQVLVTTHDIELQSVLAENYDLFHFQEDPDVEGFFDYQLRQGPTASRNAIRLLSRLSFPEEVVTRAMKYASEQFER